MILTMLLSVKSDLTLSFKDLCQWGFVTYKDFLFGIIIGMFVAWIYNYFIGHRTLKNSYELLLKSKDETIDAYKTLLVERLEKVEVDEKSQSFIKRLKKTLRKGIF